MASLEALLEAERRGILPPDKKVLIDEARTRGLIPGGGQSASRPSDPGLPKPVDTPSTPAAPSIPKSPNGDDRSWWTPGMTAAYDDQKKTVQKMGGTPGNNYLNRMARGPFLGWRDEITAGLQTGLEAPFMLAEGNTDLKSRFNENWARQKVYDDEIDANTNDGLGTAADVAGGFAMGAPAQVATGLAAGVRAAPTLWEKGAQFVKDVPNLVKQGAIYGGAAAAGTKEGSVSDRLAEVPAGATEGAKSAVLFGGMLHGVDAARNARNNFNLRRSQARVDAAKAAMDDYAAADVDPLGPTLSTSRTVQNTSAGLANSVVGSDLREAAGKSIGQTEKGVQKLVRDATEGQTDSDLGADIQGTLEHNLTKYSIPHQDMDTMSNADLERVTGPVGEAGFAPRRKVVDPIPPKDVEERNYEDFLQPPIHQIVRRNDIGEIELPTFDEIPPPRAFEAQRQGLVPQINKVVEDHNLVHANEYKPAIDELTAIRKEIAESQSARDELVRNDRGDIIKHDNGNTYTRAQFRKEFGEDPRGVPPMPDISDASPPDVPPYRIYSRVGDFYSKDHTEPLSKEGKKYLPKKTQERLAAAEEKARIANDKLEPLKRKYDELSAKHDEVTQAITAHRERAWKLAIEERKAAAKAENDREYSTRLAAEPARAQKEAEDLARVRAAGATEAAREQARLEAEAQTRAAQRESDKEYNRQLKEGKIGFQPGSSTETYPTEFEAAYEMTNRNTPKIQRNPLGGTGPSGIQIPNRGPKSETMEGILDTIPDSAFKGEAKARVDQAFNDPNYSGKPVKVQFDPAEMDALKDAVLVSDNNTMSAKQYERYTHEAGERQAGKRGDQGRADRLIENAKPQKPPVHIPEEYNEMDARHMRGAFEWAEAELAKPKAERLAAWIVRHGGVQDPGKEVRHLLGGNRSRPGLVNKKGMTLDDAALKAWEMGYFPNHGERPTINDLLDAIHDDVNHNPRVTVHDEQVFESRTEAEKIMNELKEAGVKRGNWPPIRTTTHTEDLLNQFGLEARNDMKAAGYKDKGVFDENGDMNPHLAKYLRSHLGSDVADRLQAFAEARKGGQVVADVGGVRKLRTAIREAAQEAEHPPFPAQPRTRDAAMLRRLEAAVTEDMHSFLHEAGPEGVRASNMMRNVDQGYKNHLEDLRRPLSKLFGPKVSPIDALGKLSTAAQRGDLQLLRRFMRVMTEKSDPQRAAASIVQHMTQGAKDLPTFLNEFGKIPADSRDVLFAGKKGREYREALERFERIGNKLMPYYKAVQSGGGIDFSKKTNLFLAMGAYSHFWATAGAAYAGSRLSRYMASPKYIRWMTELPAAVQKGPASPAAIKQLVRAIAIANSDPEDGKEFLRAAVGAMSVPNIKPNTEAQGRQ